MQTLSKEARSFLLLGAISGFLAIALGSFATHALRPLLSDGMLATFQTGVDYQFRHAFALLVIGLLLNNDSEQRKLHIAGWAFATGILLFSCSLYLLALTGTPLLGIVTPIGGIILLFGWAMLIWYLITDK